MFDAESARRERCGALTARERECLRLVLEHHSSKEIGRLLGVSQTSVDTHLRRARHKLGVNERYAAARLLAEWESRGHASGGHAAPAKQASPPRRGSAWRLPPLGALNLSQRLALVVAGSLVCALAFGAMASARAAL